MITSVDIIGLGALGTMYAAFFSSALGKERLRILCDARRAARYAASPVIFNGAALDLQFCDAALETRPCELLLVCTKYGGLNAAMDTAAHLVGPDTVILSVLNGIRAEGELAARFGAEKIIACTAQKMDALREGNTVSCTNRGELAIGLYTGGRPEKLAEVCAFFDAAGFYYTTPDMRHTKWAKLLCNVGVNQTVAYYAGTYATVQVPGEAREMMRAAMRETVAVANAEGVALSEGDVEEWCALIDGLNPQSEPSMRQDAKAGRRTEVELFAGTVCALGRKHGIATPVNDIFLAHFTA